MKDDFTVLSFSYSLILLTTDKEEKHSTKTTQMKINAAKSLGSSACKKYGQI
jgi:hypothetical protein